MIVGEQRIHKRVRIGKVSSISSRNASRLTVLNALLPSIFNGVSGVGLQVQPHRMDERFLASLTPPRIDASPAPPPTVQKTPGTRRAMQRVEWFRTCTG